MKLIKLLVFLLVFTSCKHEIIKEITIQEDVQFLADDALEGRQTGTIGEQKAAKYIAERFKNLGLTPKGTDGYFQAFSFKPKTDPHQEVKYNVKDGDSTITGTNVLGFIDNKETLIIILILSTLVLSLNPLFLIYKLLKE